MVRFGKTVKGWERVQGWMKHTCRFADREGFEGRHQPEGRVLLDTDRQLGMGTGLGRKVWPLQVLQLLLRCKTGILHHSQAVSAHHELLRGIIAGVLTD